MCHYLIVPISFLKCLFNYIPPGAKCISNVVAAGQRRKDVLRGSELAREQPSGFEVEDPSDVHLAKFGAAEAANAAAEEMASGRSQSPSLRASPGPKLGQGESRKWTLSFASSRFKRDLHLSLDPVTFQQPSNADVDIFQACLPGEGEDANAPAVHNALKDLIASDVHSSSKHCDMACLCMTSCAHNLYGANLRTYRQAVRPCLDLEQSRRFAQRSLN